MTAEKTKTPEEELRILRAKYNRIHGAASSMLNVMNPDGEVIVSEEEFRTFYNTLDEALGF